MFEIFAYDVQTFVSKTPSSIICNVKDLGARTHSLATTVMPSEGATTFSASAVEELKTLAAAIISYRGDQGERHHNLQGLFKNKVLT